MEFEAKFFACKFHFLSLSESFFSVFLEAKLLKSSLFFLQQNQFYPQKTTFKSQARLMIGEYHYILTLLTLLLFYSQMRK